MQKQIKITVSDKLYKIIESKAKNMGTKTSTYCYNIVFSDVKKEAEIK
ncbi:MAG: hypothetical protein AABW89_04905 [Nanoarchaeota archaeon]